MAELLEIEGLTVEYHTDGGIVQVLDSMDLSMQEGEVMGLVGESGCGKSTLGRAVLGILPRQSAVIRSGRILFRGRDLLQVPQGVLRSTIRGRRITFIPQDPFGSFNPLFTIGQQMRELMKWKSPAVAEKRAKSAPYLLWPYNRRRRRSDREAILQMLHEVQIPNPAQVLEKLPGELSGGQRQRIMIAMALLPEPDLIIADEPTTALDVTIQAQILRLFDKLVKDRGVSVLFTTHDLGTAYEICDHVTVMYAGQEAESAQTEAFFTAPHHPYTRMLLESLPRPDGAIVDIPGGIPPLVDPPSGCRFHPRCPHATDSCQIERPHVRSVGDMHRVRCFHPLEVAC